MGPATDNGQLVTALGCSRAEIRRAERIVPGRRIVCGHRRDGWASQSAPTPWDLAGSANARNGAPAAPSLQPASRGSGQPGLPGAGPTAQALQSPRSRAPGRKERLRDPSPRLFSRDERVNIPRPAPVGGGKDDGSSPHPSSGRRRRVRAPFSSRRTALAPPGAPDRSRARSAPRPDRRCQAVRLGGGHGSWPGFAGYDCYGEFQLCPAGAGADLLNAPAQFRAS